MFGNWTFPYVSATSTTHGSPVTNYSVCNTGTINTGLIVNCDPTLSLSCVNYLNNVSGTTVGLPNAVRSTFMTGFSTILGGNNMLSGIEALTQLIKPNNNIVVIQSNIASSGLSSEGWANFVAIDF